MSTELQQHQSFELTNGNSLLSLGTQLADFIKTKGLSQQIQGREYVNIEGWQFAGGMLGIMPIIQQVEDISPDDSEIKYQASCDLINIHTGNTVGGGVASCSNKEKGKKFFEAYAIQSMAQTRCVGKAYRLMLGWLMKAAGYEATPSEELDTVKEQENEIKGAVMEYLQSENRDQAKAVWDKSPQYHRQPDFLKAAKALSALYPEPLASEEQIKLLTSLLNSHHIPADYVAHVTGKLGEEVRVSQAGGIIDKLQKLLADGIEYEKNTAATEEQVETIEILLENAVFSDEEESKGKEALKQGLSIHRANLFIAKLEKKLQDANKKLQEEVRHAR